MGFAILFVPVSLAAMTLTACVADASPTMVGAVAGDQTATVTWLAPRTTAHPTVAYVVTPWIGDTPQSPTQYNSTATSQVVTGLTNGTTYTFTVFAVDAMGTDSASSDSSNAVTPGSATSTDCTDEDLFTDQVETPRIYVLKSAFDFNGFIGNTWNPTTKAFTPTATNPITHDMVVVAEYQSFDGGHTQPSLITATGPTAAAGSGPAGVSSTAISPSTRIGSTAHVDATGVRGVAYMMYGINAAGKVVAFNTATPQAHGLIAYEIPDDAHLRDNDTSGSVIPYTVKYHAIDSDDPNAFTNPAAVTHCGNGSWTFTGTKNGGGSSGGSCGEDSFFANGVYPASGTIDLSQTRAVGAFYSDESHIQDRDFSDPYWTTQTGYPDTDFGIVFELSGGDFTDVNGNPTAIPKSATVGNIDATDGYTLTPQPDTSPQTIPGLAHPDKYNTRINYNVPAADDPRWVNGVTYTLHLRAYDTDNNKPGNDCGQVTWSFVLGDGA